MGGLTTIKKKKRGRTNHHQKKGKKWTNPQKKTIQKVSRQEEICIFTQLWRTSSNLQNIASMGIFPPCWKRDAGWEPLVKVISSRLQEPSKEKKICNTLKKN